MVKLLIPLALAGLALGLNYWIMSAKLGEMEKPARFVRAATNINRGDNLSASNLEEALMTGLPVDTTKTWVPYSNVAIFYGQKTTRALPKGDLLQWSDTASPAVTLHAQQAALFLEIEEARVALPLLQPGDQIGFIVSRGPNPSRAEAFPLSTRPAQPVASGLTFGGTTGGTTASVPGLASSKKVEPFELLGPFTLVDIRKNEDMIRRSMSPLTALTIRVEWEQTGENGPKLLKEPANRLLAASRQLSEERLRGVVLLQRPLNP